MFLFTKENLTEENNLGHIKILDSVGCVFNTSTGDTMSIMADGSFDPDDPINVVDCDKEWFTHLSEEDFDLVLEWVDKDGLLRTYMLNDESVLPKKRKFFKIDFLGLINMGRK